MNKRHSSSFDSTLPSQALPAVPPAQAAPDPTTEFRDRLSRARDRAAAETQTQNLSARVPMFLARYADQYAARSGTTKQEIIAEALCLFAAHHALPPVQAEEDI